MKKLLTFLLLTLLVPCVLADLIVPFTVSTIAYFPLIVIIEIIGFWLLTNKAFKIKASFWKSVLIILVANVVTSLIGTFIPVYGFSLYAVAITFVISVLIEFGIYVLFFIKEKKVSKMNLFLVSLIVNFFSYLILLLRFRLL